MPARVDGPAPTPEQASLAAVNTRPSACITRSPPASKSISTAEKRTERGGDPIGDRRPSKSGRRTADPALFHEYIDESAYVRVCVCPRLGPLLDSDPTCSRAGVRLQRQGGKCTVTHEFGAAFHLPPRGLTPFRLYPQVLDVARVSAYAKRSLGERSCRKKDG